MRWCTKDGKHVLPHNAAPGNLCDGQACFVEKSKALMSEALVLELMVLADAYALNAMHEGRAEGKGNAFPYTPEPRNLLLRKLRSLRES